MKLLKAHTAKTSDLIVYSLLSVVGIIIFYIRFRYLDMPFERDEGEYAYGAQLLLRGDGLYDNLYSLKWPGIFLSYVLTMLFFGQTVWGIHFGVLILNAATAFIIYKIGSHIITRLSSVIGALCFLLFTIQREIHGIVANSEHFVIFYFSISLLLIFKYRLHHKISLLFWSGIFSGFAFLNKQHAIGYVLSAVAILLLCELKRDTVKSIMKPLSTYCIGLVSPFVAAILWILLFDNFDRFWFHTVTYAREYVTLISFDEAWYELSKRISENLAVNPILWGTFFLSVIFIPLSSHTRKQWKILYPLLIGAVVATSLGFYFRPHYFMFMSLVGALFLAIFFDYLYQYRSKVLAVVCFILGVTTYFVLEKDYLFQWDGNWTNYQMFYRHPFREAKIVGDYLKANSDKNDRVLVIGAEPEINFYAQRKSVTGYIYTYPFFEDHPFAKEMSDEWMDEINVDHPEYIVLMGHWKTYVSREHPTFKEIWDFSESFISENGYQVIGEVDLPIQDGGMVWGVEAANKRTESENWIRVYKKFNSKM